MFKPVTLTFDLLLKKLILDHKFWTKSDRALVLHISIPCDKKVGGGGIGPVRTDPDLVIFGVHAATRHWHLSAKYKNTHTDLYEIRWHLNSILLDGEYCHASFYQFCCTKKSTNWIQMILQLIMEGHFQRNMTYRGYTTVWNATMRICVRRRWMCSILTFDLYCDLTNVVPSGGCYRENRPVTKGVRLRNTSNWFSGAALIEAENFTPGVKC